MINLNQLKTNMFFQMIFVISYHVVIYTMRHASDMPKTYFIVILPDVVVEFVHTITVDDNMMRNTYRAAMNRVEVGFGNRHLHVVSWIKCLKNRINFILEGVYNDHEKNEEFFR